MVCNGPFERPLRLVFLFPGARFVAASLPQKVIRSRWEMAELLGFCRGGLRRVEAQKRPLCSGQVIDLIW